MIGTEVIVEGGHRLDVFEGLDFSFNYSVSDIREPDTRQTEYTKTIKCPGTSNNNTLFGNLFEADIANPFDPNIDNIGVNFNPNKKASVQVLQNSLPVLDGSMQLRRISVTDGHIQYEVVFIGRLIDLFGVWGDRKMNEVDESGNYIIDLSEFDHALTQANQEASWSAPIGEGYVYPLIDYGFSTGLVDANGIRTYPAVYQRPAVYVKEYFNKMFALAGATYSGSILNDTQADGFEFDRLIIPWAASIELSDQDIREREVFANRTIDRELYPLPEPPTGYLYDMNQTTLDENGQLDLLTSEFTINESGTYSFSGLMKVRVEKTSNGGNTAPLDILMVLRLNGVVYNSQPMQFNLPQTVDPIGFSVSTDMAFTFPDLPFSAGDVVTLRYTVPLGNFLVFNDAFLLSSSSVQMNVAQQFLGLGQTLRMNFGLPDLTIKDFFLSIVKMFNLYMVPDKTVADLYHFYTRDEFYASGQLRDWTYKMDRSQAIDITPMGLLSGREYIYTYAADEDYYNTRYQSKYGRSYGTRRLDIDNDFVPSEKVNEIVFSPTPLANDGASSRIIPKIYDADISNGAVSIDHNVRILYYGGLLPSNPMWRHQGLTDILRTTYPYAGHWNNPITPTLDINFGLSFEYYYQGNGATGPIQFTNNNLFKAYHERQFLEIASKDSKLITAMFLLNPLDIHQLDFRDTILIDQTYYRLNKVLNYNPFKSGLTKVELFKAGDIAFKGAESVAEGSGKALGSGKLEEKAPNANGKTLINGNQFEPFQGKVIGSNNVVSPNATGFFVQGDGNTVGASKNVTLIGSNCTVANGVQNVTAIGVQGVTISKSDTVINGTGGIQYAKLTTPTAQVLTLNTTPKAFGLIVPTGFYVQLLSAQMKATYNSATYATNTELEVGFAGVKPVFLDSVLGFGSSTFVNLDYNDSGAVSAASDVIVSVNNGNPTVGNSDITIYLTYVLIPL